MNVGDWVLQYLRGPSQNDPLGIFPTGYGLITTLDSSSLPGHRGLEESHRVLQQ